MVLKFSGELTKLVNSMQNEIDQLKNTNCMLKSGLEEKTVEYEKLQEKYDVINTKFTTMKKFI